MSGGGPALGPRLRFVAAGPGKACALAFPPSPHHGKKSFFIEKKTFTKKNTCEKINHKPVKNDALSSISKGKFTISGESIRIELSYG